MLQLLLCVVTMIPKRSETVPWVVRLSIWVGQLGYNNKANVGIGGPGGTIQEAGDVPVY